MVCRAAGRLCAGLLGPGSVTLLIKGYRLAAGLICGLVKGLHQWLVVCGIGLASIRA